MKQKSSNGNNPNKMIVKKEQDKMDLERKFQELTDDLQKLKGHLSKIENELEKTNERIDAHYEDISVILKVIRKRFPEESI